jgi:hypothetical protein
VNKNKEINCKLNLNLSAWKKFIYFINNMPTGKEFTRRQLLIVVYGKTDAMIIRSTATAADQYRLKATHCGFIKHIRNGLYKKIHDIPLKMTAIKIYDYAQQFTSDQWKSWFIPQEKRLETILKDFQ